MMMAKKYRDEFLSKDENKEMANNIDKIVEMEEEFGVDVLEWRIMHLERFLRSIHSISSNILLRAKSHLETYGQYIYEQEGLGKYKPIRLERGRIDDLVDKDKVLSVTINFEEYQYIIRQLDDDIRNKVIFELAWLTLTNSEIKNLKIQDVVTGLISPKTGLEMAEIHLPKGRILPVEDAEVIEDLKKCKTQYYYHVESSDDVTKQMQLKDTNYLIRAINVGRKKENGEDSISNPSIALQSALRSKNIICPGIDVQNMSIEDIRRSKIIFLLSPQKRQYFDVNLISIMLGGGNITSQLSKWEKIAKLKYKD